jgi:hypothetical protein
MIDRSTVLHSFFYHFQRLPIGATQPEGFSSSEEHGIDAGKDALESSSSEGHRIFSAKPSQNNFHTDTSEDNVHSGKSADIVRESI